MVVILIVGVCGCGKTTVGKALAKELAWPFEDADNFHPESNICKMKQGIPLSDEDRHPWLLSLNKVVQNWQNNSESGILGCSALKRSYRDTILYGENRSSDVDGNHPSKYSLPYLVVLLEGSKQLLCERMLKRQDHFMPSSLLDSQFEILEPLESSPFSINISINKTIEEITMYIIEQTKIYH